jgi:hypothetical protein
MNNQQIKKLLYNFQGARMEVRKKERKARGKN